MRGGRSSAVSTACTPGIARAAAASIDRIRACACGLRTKQACSTPGSFMSSTKRRAPGEQRRIFEARDAGAEMLRAHGRISRNGATRRPTIHRKHCIAIATDRTLVAFDGPRSRPCSTSAPTRAFRTSRRGTAARFPGASRRARGAGPAGARRSPDQQGHRAASAGALAVPGRARRSAAPRVPVHQRGRRGGPPLRHSGRGRRAGGLAAHLRGRHGPPGRGDRGGVAARHRPSDPAGRGVLAAVPGRS